MTPSSPSAERGLRFRTHGPDDTRELAAALAQELVCGDLLVLTGDLGAGKTCFAQGLAVGLGIDDPVTSPTFTLANRYHGRLTLHHLDVYRLDSEADALDLAFEELLDDGLVVVEWGERVAGLLPENRLVITLRYDDAGAGGAGGAEDDGDESSLAELDRRTIMIEEPRPGRGLARTLARWLDGSAEQEPCDA